MMDLLIFLCAKYHLNPSSHTIDLLSAEKNPIKFKPNTPIGMLEVEKVILKPKILDKKKPTPIIPEVRFFTVEFDISQPKYWVDFFSHYLQLTVNEKKKCLFSSNSMYTWLSCFPGSLFLGFTWLFFLG